MRAGLLARIGFERRLARFPGARWLFIFNRQDFGRREAGFGRRVWFGVVHDDSFHGGSWEWIVVVADSAFGVQVLDGKGFRTCLNNCERSHSGRSLPPTQCLHAEGRLIYFALGVGILTKGQRENAEGSSPSARSAQWTAQLFFNLPILPLKSEMVSSYHGAGV